MTEKLQELVHDDAHSSEKALGDLTDAAVNDHNDSSLGHIHGNAETPETHSWIKKYLPHHINMHELENGYHLGNYVIDRETGQKSWEASTLSVSGQHRSISPGLTMD